VREKLWWFIVKFALVSLPLFAFWVWKGEAWYLAFLGQSLTLLVIKTAGLNQMCFPAPKPILLNLIPFLSLMIITRGIKLQPRIIRMSEGFVILVVWHMILTEAVYLLLDCQGTTPAYEKLSVPLYLLSGTLPFILWMLFAPKQVAGLFSRRKRKTR
jgi:hypothetical protein